MRLLSDDELRWVSGGLPASGYEGEVYEDSSGAYIWENGSWQPYEIPVTGPPTPPPPPFGGGGGGDTGIGGSGGTGVYTPPTNNCFNPNQDTSTMTPEQRSQFNKDLLDYKIDAAAAKFRAEALLMPNQNSEYGAVMYEDENGNIQYSPLRPSANATANIDWSVLPTQADGTYDYSKVVGIIHTHPRYLPDGNGGLNDYWNASDRDYLMRPSNMQISNGQLIGDWLSAQAVTNEILRDGGGDRLALFRLYIAGFNGTTLGLNEYDQNKWETRTTSGYINPVTGHC